MAHKGGNNNNNKSSKQEEGEDIKNNNPTVQQFSHVLLDCLRKRLLSGSPLVADWPIVRCLMGYLGGIGERRERENDDYYSYFN